MISRTGTHTLKALLSLRQIPVGSYAGAEQLALQVHAPANYLSKLLRQIARAGIVEGRKGRNGGFRLTSGWRTLSLFDVLSPIEHFESFKACFLGKPRCTPANPCLLHEGWSRVRDQYVEFLKATTLSDIAGDKLRSRRKRGLADHAPHASTGGV